MARFLWSPMQRKWVAPEERMAERARESKRSRLAAPSVIADTMETRLNHADGRRYTSKREYERAVRRTGCEIVGNDASFARAKPKSYDAGDIKADINRAIEEAGSG
jgi:hypothetical protein